jgi:hypothetical protein
VLYGVREESRESERSLQSSKEWEDIVAVFAPWVKSSHILCYNVFHFCDFWRYFGPDFLSRDLRSFSSIPSMGLSARTSLVIYFQPWSESMALVPSI